jgi:transcriptional regulator with XRE-family HTH domain
MWRDKLIEIKKEKGITSREWAQLSDIPIDTINRIVSKKDKKEAPRIDTLEKLCYGLGVELWEIFYLGDHSLVALQAEINTLKSERDTLVAENAVLKDKVETLRDKVDTLKDDIIATHNYYNKIKSNG